MNNLILTVETIDISENELTCISLWKNKISFPDKKYKTLRFPAYIKEDDKIKEYDKMVIFTCNPIFYTVPIQKKDIEEVVKLTGIQDYTVNIGTYTVLNMQINNVLKIENDESIIIVIRGGDGDENIYYTKYDRNDVAHIKFIEGIKKAFNSSEKLTSEALL